VISLDGTQWQGKRSEAVPVFDLSVMIRRPAAEVFALLADVQDAEPLPRRATLRMEKDPLRPDCGRHPLARGGEDWPRVLASHRKHRAPRLRPHLAERLADIRALLESGA
jgi:hypothetical protein